MLLHHRNIFSGPDWGSGASVEFHWLACGVRPMYWKCYMLLARPYTSHTIGCVHICIKTTFPQRMKCTSLNVVWCVEKHGQQRRERERTSEREEVEPRESTVKNLNHLDRATVKHKMCTLFCLVEVSPASWRQSSVQSGLWGNTSCKLLKCTKMKDSSWIFIPVASVVASTRLSHCVFG